MGNQLKKCKGKVQGIVWPHLKGKRYPECCARAGLRQRKVRLIARLRYYVRHWDIFRALGILVLRLNGFMTTYNFVGPLELADGNGNFSQQTDVDVMGARFAHRQENHHRPMADHKSFYADGTIQLVLAETKSRHCLLNRAWLEPQREKEGLSPAGVVPAEQLNAVAAAL